MFNPNSAIDRIKNSLSYKLGLAIIECKKQHGGGYITLPYKLYKINQQHKKEQKSYKQTIKIFPQLVYPKIESCKDYSESIKYKYHFSYMLGEALIKAHKNWYKGGYFKLPFLLKEKYSLYKNIQKIINVLPQNLHYHFYNSTIKNHKINIQDLAYILKQHKDYKPILENILHNFDFFIKHFDLIRIWLSSKDFKEKYKQENHPYPSLLDPKKLNNENEKISYKNIPAELAWEMNLPLPDNYEFV
ncbi:capsular biosynthesis protein, partial [Campylobacter peloridis]